MADQEKVDQEAGQGRMEQHQVAIVPVVVIGHKETGELTVILPGGHDVFRGLAFLRAAEKYLMDNIVFDKPPESKIALVPGMPPGLNGRPH